MVPFRWIALFPLLALALQEEDIENAVRWAQHLITPPQQRLPDELATSLARAVDAREHAPKATAGDFLRQALQLAQKPHYL